MSPCWQASPQPPARGSSALAGASKAGPWQTYTQLLYSSLVLPGHSFPYCWLGVYRCTRIHSRMRRVCAGAPVHYEQTVREEDAACV
jgi:hypothetical protein